MKDSNIIYTVNTERNSAVLKEIFEIYAEETITDEQVWFILEPVLLMIWQGKFTRSFRNRFSWLIKPLIPVVSVIIFAIAIAMI